MSRSISRDELKGMMDSGESFVLVNVLDNEDYENEHICGSINIPVEYIEDDAKDLIGKDETVIVHCYSPGCEAGKEAADILENLGYKDVRTFEGGIEEWKNAGYCLEGRMYEVVQAA